MISRAPVATRRLTAVSSSNRIARASLKANQFLSICLLAFFVLLSAFSVVYLKQFNRQLIIEAETLQNNAEAMHTAWGQLLLEQAAWSTQVRLQVVAQQQLGMEIPSPKEIKMVQM